MNKVISKSFLKTPGKKYSLTGRQELNFGKLRQVKPSRRLSNTKVLVRNCVSSLFDMIFEKNQANVIPLDYLQPLYFQRMRKIASKVSVKHARVGGVQSGTNQDLGSYPLPGCHVSRFALASSSLPIQRLNNNNRK